MIHYYGALVLLLTGLLSFSVTANQEEITMTTTNTESNVLKTIQAMTSSFHHKDMQGVLSSYENNASVMFEPGLQVSSRLAIQEMFEGSFQLNPQFTYPNGHEVYIADDLALHIAPWVMTGKAPDGTEVEQAGLSVAVLRKQSNGKWLLVLDNPHGQRLMGNK